VWRCHEPILAHFWCWTASEVRENRVEGWKVVDGRSWSLNMLTKLAMQLGDVQITWLCTVLAICTVFEVERSPISLVLWYCKRKQFEWRKDLIRLSEFFHIKSGPAWTYWREFSVQREQTVIRKRGKVTTSHESKHTTATSSLTFLVKFDHSSY
jgi:hypothetical protein